MSVNGGDEETAAVNGSDQTWWLPTVRYHYWNDLHCWEVTSVHVIKLSAQLQFTVAGWKVDSTLEKVF